MDDNGSVLKKRRRRKKIRYFLRQNKKWCFKIAPQAKNFEYLALGIRFLLRKSSLDNVRFPKIFFPPTMGGKYPKIFSISPPRWGGNALDFPPTTLWSGGEIIPDFPPLPSKVGGKYFQKPPFPPQWGGNLHPCPRDDIPRSGAKTESKNDQKAEHVIISSRNQSIKPTKPRAYGVQSRAQCFVIIWNYFRTRLPMKYQYEIDFFI